MRVAVILAVLAARVLLGEGGFAPIQAQVVSAAGEWPFGAAGHDHDHGTQPGANLDAAPAGDGGGGGKVFKDASGPTLLDSYERDQPSPATVPPKAPSPPPLVVPTSPEQWIASAPSGRNAGTEGIANYLANLALTDNKPLYVSDVWGRTSGGANSDHHVSQVTSWAVDLAVRGIQQPTPATETAAARIASSLGEPGWTGGNMTKTINGYRIQVLWKVAGHYNHVHVGIRKV